MVQVIMHLHEEKNLYHLTELDISPKHGEKTRGSFYVRKTGMGQEDTYEMLYITCVNTEEQVEVKLDGQQRMRLGKIMEKLGLCKGDGENVGSQIIKM